MKLIVVSSLGNGQFELSENIKTWADLKNFLIEENLYSAGSNNEGMKNAFKTNAGTEGQFTNDGQLLGDVEMLLVSLTPTKVSSGTDWNDPFGENFSATLEEDFLSDGDSVELNQLMQWPYANLKAFAKHFRKHLISIEDETIASEIGHDYMNQGHQNLAMRVVNAYNAYVQKYLVEDEAVKNVEEYFKSLEDRLFTIEFRMGIVNEYNIDRYTDITGNLKA